MQTIELKILEILGEKLNGKKTAGKMFGKIWVYLVTLSSSWKFLEMLFHSSLEVVENANRTFWLNEECPESYLGY